PAGGHAPISPARRQVLWRAGRPGMARERREYGNHNMSVSIDGKRILVTGGTGSLGQRVVRRLLEGSVGHPERVTVLSRDEAKQHEMRLRFLQRDAATDDVIYQHARGRLAFRIGDVRDYTTLVEAVRR